MNAPDAGAGLRLIFVRGLVVQARLGVHPHEKAQAQRVEIGLELAVADPEAPAGVGADDFRRVVDYAALVALAKAEASAGHVLLVETLAERIAVAALADPRVQRIRVSIAKPDAFPDVASVGVVVERQRST
jgi:dihydroneopterin aldolase